MISLVDPPRDEAEITVGAYEDGALVGTLCAVKDELDPDVALLFGFDHSGGDASNVLKMVRRMRAELAARGYTKWRAVLTTNFDMLGALGALGFELTAVVATGDLEEG